MLDPNERLIAQLAERRIADFWPLPWVWISGVEVTQAIQYYRAAQHLTDPADRGADNSVRLVANKPAWVRVYVRSFTGATVSASLQVRRRRFGFRYLDVDTLTPRAPGTATADLFRAYATERSDPSTTVNFVIPATMFWGNLQLVVRLTSPTGDREYDSETLAINATLRQTLRLRAIRVSYNGPATANVPAGSPPPPTVNLAAPTIGAVQTTSGRALLMMPVQSAGNFATAGTLAWTLPLDDPRTGAGGCSNNWNSLLPALGNIRTNDGNRADVVYYGILPAAIPIGVPGCGVNGLGAGRSGDQGTLVHEIGHGYGFQHTPCGATGASDPSYPTYQPYPSASIGEYGININNGTVLPPASTFDYMSYCFPQWMSLYQHNRLINHARLDPEWVGDNPIWADKLEFREYFAPRDLPTPPPDPWKELEMRFNPIISITGVVRARDEIDVMTVARVDAAGAPPGDATDLSAELVDAEGRVIARGDVIRLHSHGGDCGCDGASEGGRPPYPFQAFIPNVDRGAAIRITDEDRVVWERRASGPPPKVGRVSAKVDGDQLRVDWEASSEDEAPEVWLQWSDDEGQTWHGLTTGIRERGAVVDLGGLPAGTVQVRALVHDGFDTTVSRPTGVRLPARPPEVAIHSPKERETLIAGRTLRLWAGAINADGSPVADDEVTWQLDGERAGTGTDVWLDAPSPGEHRAVVTVGRGKQRVEEAVTFVTVDPDELLADERQEPK